MPDRMPIAGFGQNPNQSAGGSSPSPFPSGGQTLGRPMYPWLESWQGPHVAPMTGMQNQLLENMFKLYGGGGGNAFDQSKSWGANIHSSNPAGGGNSPADLSYVNQIKDSAQVLKDYEDEQALKRIASSSAAGGNALSGARMGAEQDYLRNSGAAFNQNIAEIMQSALENERNRNNAVRLANIGVGPQYASVNQRANEASMDNQLRGMGMLWGAAGDPQEMATRELQGQYGDWLRQIGALRDEFRYPEQLALQTLNAGRYSGQTPNQYGPSQAAGWAALLASLFGNGGSGGLGNSTGGQVVGGLADLISALFGGGSGSGGGHDYGLGYDNYEGFPWYDSSMDLPQNDYSQLPEIPFDSSNPWAGY